MDILKIFNESYVTLKLSRLIFHSSPYYFSEELEFSLMGDFDNGR